MKRFIYEGARGASRISAENIIPPDAEKITFETRSSDACKASGVVRAEIQDGINRDRRKNTNRFENPGFTN